MQRKPGFPVVNCNIKLPDGNCNSEASLPDDGIEADCQRRRQQLINYAHSIWGFNNWSWSVKKQELDFIDFTNGKYTAGVVAFVSITVKTFDIHREDIGYATSVALMKGSAIYRARKSAVTNALKETLLSFGGTVASELTQQLEAEKVNNPIKREDLAVNLQENNQNVANEPSIIAQANGQDAHRHGDGGSRKDSSDSSSSSKDGAVPNAPNDQTSQRPSVVLSAPSARATGVTKQPTHAVKPQPPPAGGHPANRAPRPGAPPAPPANQPPPQHRAPQPHHLRSNSNVSFVLQPVLPGVVPPLYSVQCAAAAPPARVPRAHIFPNPYYADCTPFRLTYEGFDRHHTNVNLNFNIPPKNLVVSGPPGMAERAGERAGMPLGAGASAWIKPTIFYDGFWTEQKVKNWVSEQCERPPQAEPAHDTTHNHTKN